MNVEKTKIIIDEFGKTKFTQIYPFDVALESLLNYVKDMENENERLKQRLEEYSKDEEVSKYREEAQRVKSNSLYMLDDDERNRAREFAREHYGKCGRAGYIRYIVTPTGIGTSVVVECNKCKEKIDISNFNNW